MIPNTIIPIFEYPTFGGELNVMYFISSTVPLYVDMEGMFVFYNWR